MAQLAGIMLRSRKENSSSMAYLLGVDKVKFRRRVVPGDQLVVEARIRSRRRRAAVVDTVAGVDGSTAAEARISFMLVPDTD